ncbi:hypothetical protein [Vulcaniibacterium gelatinicum]|uniref:hypothetical protein n=1 Tax=Vulcaniibacterium gelatinicum TaxID=2598725 RepID=UPI0011C97A19|nr:hypothetical protein [Vulcaniibacterium gelatinicum]
MKHGMMFGAGGLALALAAAFAYAQRGHGLPDGEVAGSDLLPAPSQRALSRHKPVAPAAAGVTVEDVGDVDSFGRNLRWLGVTQMNVRLTDDCSATPPAPGAACTELLPAPALTSFNHQDVASITLPPKATHSLLCYWLSPFLTVRYDNPTAAPVVARLTLSPTLTVENSVLDDPALIDPTTGLPFGGRLRTGMTSSEMFEVPLAPGVAFTERTRDSAVCIAGFLNRRTLVDTFGLTDAQATEFFKRRTTVRMNLTGSARYVADANLIFGFRIIGD